MIECDFQHGTFFLEGGHSALPLLQKRSNCELHPRKLPCSTLLPPGLVQHPRECEVHPCGHNEPCRALVERLSTTASREALVDNDCFELLVPTARRLVFRQQQQEVEAAASIATRGILGTVPTEEPKASSLLLRMLTA